MALIKAYLGDLSGKIGGTVFAKTRAGSIARRWAQSVKPSTQAQIDVRTSMTAASAAWRSLTGSQRSAWENIATAVVNKNRLGETIAISGQQLYCSVNVDRYLCGLDRMDDAPADPGIFALEPDINPGLLSKYAISSAGVQIIGVTPPSPDLNEGWYMSVGLGPDSRNFYARRQYRGHSANAGNAYVELANVSDAKAYLTLACCYSSGQIQKFRQNAIDPTNVADLTVSGFTAPAGANGTYKLTSVYVSAVATVGPMVQWKHATEDYSIFQLPDQKIILVGIGDYEDPTSATDKATSAAAVALLEPDGSLTAAGAFTGAPSIA